MIFSEKKSWTATGVLVGASVVTLGLIVGIIYLLQKLYRDRREINQLANSNTLSRCSSVNFNDNDDDDNNDGTAVVGNNNNNNSNNNNHNYNSGIIFGSGRAGREGNGSIVPTISYDNGMMTNNLIDAF